MAAPFHSRRLSAVVLSIGAVAASCSRSPQARENVFLKSAQKHLLAQDFGRAILDFKNAAQAMPFDPEPHYQMGLAFSQAGNLPDGVNELQRAVQIDPKHVSALLKLAEILTANKIPETVKQGAEKAREVLAFSADNPDALQILAAAELRLGDKSGAIQDLETALQNSPQHLKSAAMLAVIKTRDKDLAGAEQVLKRAAGAAPRSAEHALALAQFYLQTGRSADAKEQFERALRIDPQSGSALVGLGGLAYQAGKADDAGQLLERASKLPDKTYRSVYAAFLLENGKNTEAIAEFEKLYKNNPTDRDLRTRLIAAYLRAGRPVDADKILAPVLKKDPNDSAALLQRGDLRLATGKYAEAESDAGEVLRARPDSAEGHLLMARIHRERNDASGYRRELTEVLRIDPALLTTRVELAHSLTVANSAQAALDLLDAAPEDQKQNPAVIVERNTALYTLGRYQEMRKSVDQGLEAAPNDPDLLLEDGVLRLKQHDIAGGRASLEAALKWRSEEWRALEALAMSYVSEKNVAEATSVVRQYISRVPNSVAGQQFLAAWLSLTGDTVGARLAFQTARSMAPPDSKAAASADRQLAELDLRAANLDSARNRLLSLLKAQPGDVSVVLDLAVAEYRAGRLDGAIGYYDEALRLDPNNLAALNNLAFLLADTRKDPARALLLAQRAKQLAPDDPTMNDTLGWAYYCKGDYEAAVRYLSLNKTSTPKWKCHLAMAYLKTGNRREAAALLQAALRQDPSLPEEKRVQALLEAR